MDAILTFDARKGEQMDELRKHLPASLVNMAAIMSTKEAQAHYRAEMEQTAGSHPKEAAITIHLLFEAVNHFTGGGDTEGAGERLSDIPDRFKFMHMMLAAVCMTTAQARTKEEGE